MGDPRKSRKKYRTPSHPWQKTRLDEENQLAIEYGLKNKQEIWKMDSILKNFTNQSKKLVTLTTKQAENEKLNLIKKLKTLGLLKESQGFEDILNLAIKDVMERRLQTLVHRKGLAKTMKQARQLIIHSHIIVNNKKITSPSYLIKIGEEKKIGFVPKSSFSSPDHPERIIKEKMLVKKKKTEAKPKKEIKKEVKPKKEIKAKPKKQEIKKKDLEKPEVKPKKDATNNKVSKIVEAQKKHATGEDKKETAEALVEEIKEK